MFLRICWRAPLLRALCVAVLLVLPTACRKTAPPPPAAAGPPEPDPPADAQRSATGLASKVLRPGTGQQRPEPQDLVEVHYTGWTHDGKMFDSSVARSAPAQFEVATAIKGWSEGIGMMVIGEKRRLWIPPALAYGDKPPPIAPPGPLIFDIELLKILKRPPPPATPEDLAAPPASATRTPSGLAFRVLRPATGSAHPGAGSTVEIHYSAWTGDGRLFDSSVKRGQPATVRLGAPDVIDGLKEALPHLAVGEKARVWVPPPLGYGKRVVGGPLGPLVFDIELLAIR
jgi:FKBP-type peptidyl-prolyl cis-trans isomerase